MCCKVYGYGKYPLYVRSGYLLAPSWARMWRYDCGSVYAFHVLIDVCRCDVILCISAEFVVVTMRSAVFVVDAIGDHIMEAYSSICLFTAYFSKGNIAGWVCMSVLQICRFSQVLYSAESRVKSGYVFLVWVSCLSLVRSLTWSKCDWYGGKFVSVLTLLCAAVIMMLFA